MKAEIENLLKRYEEKRKEFIFSVYPERHWLLEMFKPKEFPKFEDTIDIEMQFYNSFEKDITALQNLSGKRLTVSEWKDIAHALKIHNERLSSQLDGMSTLTSSFAFVSAILLMLAKDISPGNWLTFFLVSWLSVVNFMARFNKRPELSRNKEVLLILERYIASHA